MNFARFRDHHGGLLRPERGELCDIVDVPTGNFQDLCLWRRQVVSMALGLLEEYERPILAPMTLVDPQYVAEIFGALKQERVTIHHFFLKVPPDVLARRIDSRSVVPHDPVRDEAARRWGKAQVEQCVAAADTLPASAIFLDGERPCRGLADEVMARVGASAA